MILSRKSSLFYGKGVLFMRWMSACMRGSDYYFLRGALLMIFSSRLRVISRLASMGSLRV